MREESLVEAGYVKQRKNLWIGHIVRGERAVETGSRGKNGSKETEVGDH